MSRSSRRKRAGKAPLILVVTLAVAAVGVSAAAILRPAPDASADPAPVPTYSATTKPEIDRVELTEAMARLDDPARPFTLAILSDSTGADARSWPTLLGEWVNEHHGRPVTVYRWNDKSLEQQVLIDLPGEGAPVTIYNGAAPGRKVQYALEHLDKLIPVPIPTVDVLLVSHGHNHSHDLVEQVGWLMGKFDIEAPQAAVGLILQNPEAVGSRHAATQDTGTENLRLYAERTDRETIDVRGAFLAYGDFSTLMRDDAHPVGEGFNVWVDTVIAALDAKHG